jgi:hypothetical protein
LLYFLECLAAGRGRARLYSEVAGGRSWGSLLIAPVAAHEAQVGGLTFRLRIGNTPGSAGLNSELRGQRGEGTMSKWSMRKDRELIRLGRTKLGVDQIASRLDSSPLSVLKVAKRLGIKLPPRPSRPDGRAKAKAKPDRTAA